MSQTPAQPPDLNVPHVAWLQQVPAASLRKVAEQDPDNALGYYLVAIDKQTRKTCDKDVGE